MKTIFNESLKYCWWWQAEHFPIRLKAYKQRKENLTAKYAAEEAISRNKCKFITEIIQGNLNVLRSGGGGAVAETDLIRDLFHNQ